MADLYADVPGLSRPVPTGLYIGGKWRPAGDGGTFEVCDPADGSVLTRVADATPDDTTAAMDAAYAALPEWAATPPRKRSEIVRRAFELMLERTDDLALLMVRENGKALADARAEHAYAAEFFRWFSEEAVRIDGHYSTAPAGGTRTVVTRQPVGVCLLITPWNFPAAMLTRKLGPALAAGCTSVVKPAEETPLTALLLTELLAEAGVPDGVVNLLPTTKAKDVGATAMADLGRRHATQAIQLPGESRRDYAYCRCQISRLSSAHRSFSWFCRPSTWSPTTRSSTSTSRCSSA